MTNYYGPLQIPAPAPGQGKAAADPFLDLLLESLAAVVNSEAKAAWRSIYLIDHGDEPDRLPIRKTFAQDPRKFVSKFNPADLPALFAWRGSAPKHAEVGQSLEHRTSSVFAMWVMPSADRADAYVRDAFANVVDASVHNFSRAGRHAAWKKAGDTYADAQTRGSVFAYHTRHVDFVHEESEPTFVELSQLDPMTGSPTKTTRFEAWMMRFRLVEANERAASLIYDPIDRVEVTMNVPKGALAGETAIRAVEDADFKLTIVSISPTSGPLAGGTTVTIKVRQGSTSMRATIAGVDVANLAVVDETTLTGTTPAGASTGAKDVVAYRLDVGDSATLAGGFTYT